jgi:hypothetical protein
MKNISANNSLIGSNYLPRMRQDDLIASGGV